MHGAYPTVCVEIGEKRRQKRTSRVSSTPTVVEAQGFARRGFGNYTPQGAWHIPSGSEHFKIGGDNPPHYRAVHQRPEEREKKYYIHKSRRVWRRFMQPAGLKTYPKQIY